MKNKASKPRKPKKQDRKPQSKVHQFGKLTIPSNTRIRDTSVVVETDW